MVLQLRPYQLECLDHAKERNTIVNLPTGKGKTLIAAKLIDHFLCGSPHKHVVFLVPTRPLVEQQAKYLETHCRLGKQLTVLRLVGTDSASWSQDDWNKEVSQCEVLVGTEELFRQAFVEKKFISLSR